MMISPLQFGSLDKARRIAERIAVDAANKAELAVYQEAASEVETDYAARKKELEAVLNTEFVKTPFGDLTGLDLLQAAYDHKKETGSGASRRHFLSDVLPQSQQDVTAGLDKLIGAGLLYDRMEWGAEFEPTDLAKFILLKPKFSAEA